VTLNGDGCVAELKLSNTQLVGNIPPEISDLNSLTYLNLGSNQLIGNIPSEIGDMTELTFLSISNNQLVGSIPPEIGNLNNLTALSLGRNELSGNIPVELANLSSLTWFWLSENELTGSIPVELSNLTNVEWLWVADNQLTGSIPPEIADMTNLTWLWLSGNQLSGCYDMNLTTLCSQLDANYSNNNYISNGNAFYSTWEDFCNNQESICGGPVWPGDFNDDGRAENTDLLYWGLAAGSTGTPRPNATTDWIEQDCPEWQSTVSGVNSKHQDADGNGIIDADDIAVLINNYNQTHRFTFPNYLTTTLEYRLEPLASTVDATTVTLNYALYVQEFDGPVLAHGLSCTIDFTSLPLTNASIDASASSLQVEEYIEVYNAGANTLDIALTRCTG